MKRNWFIALCVVASFVAVCGCGASKDRETTDAQTKADRVAELIDRIYVQERTEETDGLCAEAKAAWDALTDEEKALVEGEEADPDYFGRDTGDAALDDPRNDDGIGANEILVASFGTSFNASRAQDVGGIEKAVADAYPDWSVRRAFTAQIVMNHILARDGEKIDNIEQALDRAVANGVKNLVVLPTHLMRGAEYDDLVATVESYRERFESVKIAKPLLGEVGANASETNSDKELVAKAVVEQAALDFELSSNEDLNAAGVALVLLGHGTSHTASVTYSQMQTQVEALGYKNVWIGTVEGKPESTSCENTLEAVAAAGFKRVLLRPLMVVAGDHAYNDMAGDDEDSWKSVFERSGKFEQVDVQTSGLGRVEAIQGLYLKHVAEIVE